MGIEEWGLRSGEVEWGVGGVGGASSDHPSSHSKKKNTPLARVVTKVVHSQTKAAEMTTRFDTPSGEFREEGGGGDGGGGGGGGVLVLFDIDGTLLNTHGLGMRVIAQAATIEFGQPISTHGVEFAGRLDPLIFADTLANNGLQPTPNNLKRLRNAYVNLFHDITHNAESPLGSACPGVLDLLDQLEKTPTSIGVLTGNIQETGTRKLAHCGLDPARFHINVWGDDSITTTDNHTKPDRAQLPPIGLHRYTKHTGKHIPPDRVIIVGDTPHDIRCARVNSMRSIGVATGSTSVADLERAGADLAVPTLQDTDAILQWIFCTST